MQNPILERFDAIVRGLYLFEPRCHVVVHGVSLLALARRAPLWLADPLSAYHEGHLHGIRRQKRRQTAFLLSR